MSIEPATLTVTGLIATGLSLVFAVAAHSTSKKRQRERARLEATLKSQQEVAPPTYSEIVAPMPVRESAETAAVRTQPAIKITAERPHAPVPQLSPPAPAGAPPRPQALQNAPSIFKQYVTRPGTKATTLVMEESPTDKDYVWE